MTPLVLPSDPTQTTIDIPELEAKTFRQFEPQSDAYMAESDPITFLNTEMQLSDPVCKYIFPDELEPVLKSNSDSDFRIMCHNINSIPFKFDIMQEDFSAFFNQNFDVIGFCESKNQ